MHARMRRTLKLACRILIASALLLGLFATGIAGTTLSLAKAAFSASELVPVTITSSDGSTSTTMSLLDSTAYAYNEAAGYFATDGDEGYEPLDVPKAGYRERDVEGALHGLDWDSSYGRQVLQSMATMEKVDAFWRDEVGIAGIDDEDGIYRLFVLPEELDGGARCLTAKRDGTVYSYAIMLGLAPDGQTIGAYPEVLCHEYTHGVLSNLVQYAPGNGEHGALNEAIADIFAACYLKDPSWHLAAGLESYGFDKDIKANKRTMADYDYEQLFGKLVYQFFYSVTKGTDTSGAINIHENSYIVSHTVYEIWRDVYGQDFGKLTDTMANALTVIPAKADFGDFREAFTAAARLLYGDETAAEVEGYFDKAKIKNKGSVIITKARTYDGGGNRIDLTEQGTKTEVKDSGSSTTSSQPSQTHVEDFRSALAGSGSTHFAMVDLDGDGSNELLATDNVYEGGKAYNASVYALRDGVPTCVLSYVGSSFDYLKYDAASSSLVAPWGGAGSNQWITYYLQGSKGLTEYLTEDMDHGTYSVDVYDDDFNQVSYQDLSKAEFDQRLATWKERDARASYVTFNPLP